MVIAIFAKFNASVGNRSDICVFGASTQYACPRHVHALFSGGSRPLSVLTPRFASVCVWSSVWCSHLTFWCFQRTGPGKWSGRRGPPTEKPHMENCKPDNGIRLGVNSDMGRAGIFGIETGTPPVHATEKKDVTCQAGSVVKLVTMRNFQKDLGIKHG